MSSLSLSHIKSFVFVLLTSFVLMGCLNSNSSSRNVSLPANLIDGVITQAGYEDTQFYAEDKTNLCFVSKFGQEFDMQIDIGSQGQDSVQIFLTNISSDGIQTHSMTGNPNSRVEINTDFGSFVSIGSGLSECITSFEVQQRSFGQIVLGAIQCSNLTDDTGSNVIGFQGQFQCLLDD